jgi:hypothetical protein
MRLQGLSAALFDEIKKIPVVDCHEHLPTEAERLAHRADVTTLFSHYCLADLSCAGLPYGREQNEVFDTTQPLVPRWQKLKPAFEAIRFGSYAYPALAYVRDVLGFDDINDDTVEAISQKMQDSLKPGYYRRTIQELCGIEMAIQCTGRVVSDDQDFFVYLCPDRACGIPRAALEQETNRSIHTLSEYVSALRQYVADRKQEGAVGYKVSAAYQRRIDFPDVAQAEAEGVFIRMRAGIVQGISSADRELLENYLLRRAVEACTDVDLPVVIHTGYQAGVHNDIRNARATHLWSLLRDYPRTRFDLFHGSFPFVEDMTCLGKYFENVTLNMCWMHIMGPDVSRRALSQWLDAVPVTKIFAFGGDYHVPEKIYGHLQLARANVAVVLAQKVEKGRFSEEDALHIAQLIFCDNPKRWYKLNTPST